MGSVNKITCGSCKREWQCMTGCGLLHARLEDVIREFPEETGREIAEQAGAEEFPLFDFAYRCAVCMQCRSVVGVPVLELPDQSKEYIGRCPICGGAAQPIADLQEAHCPICGKKTLEEEETGSWD